jgi:hypothetical protein
VVKTKEGGVTLIFVEVQIVGKEVEIIEAVVEVMIIDVAIMLLLMMVINNNNNNNNNEGGEKVEDEAVDVVDVAKEEDGEAMTVDDGGIMILFHDVDPSIE